MNIIIIILVPLFCTLISAFFISYLYRCECKYLNREVKWELKRLDRYEGELEALEKLHKDTTFFVGESIREFRSIIVDHERKLQEGLMCNENKIDYEIKEIKKEIFKDKDARTNSTLT